VRLPNREAETAVCCDADASGVMLGVESTFDGATGWVEQPTAPKTTQHRMTAEVVEIRIVLPFICTGSSTSFVAGKTKIPLDASTTGVRPTSAFRFTDFRFPISDFRFPISD
jgi:hypothetical protein